MNITQPLLIRIACLSTTVAIAGCAAGPATRTGAAAGTLLGAATGAVVGHQSGEGVAGALIGAAAGGTAGTLLGNAQDARTERDAAIAQASAIQAQLTNDELIRMAQSGLGEDVIIHSVQTNGGQFDLSPNGLIYLKTNGVSDRVIQSVQTAAAQVPQTQQAGQSVVIVRPRPAVNLSFGRPRSRPAFSPRRGGRFRR